MADNAKGQPVRLKVTGCKVAYQGKNSRGDDYTIYEIGAERDGQPITDKKLRSFEELPCEELDLMVVPFTSEQYGTSFTLSRRNKQSRTGELAAQVKTLTERVDRCEAWIKRQVQAGNGQAPAQQATPTPTPASAELDARFGAEPPY